MSDEALQRLSESIGLLRESFETDDLDGLAEMVGVSDLQRKISSDDLQNFIMYTAMTRVQERFRDLAFVMGKKRGEVPPIW